MTPGGTSRRTDVTLRPMGLLLALLALATAVTAKSRAVGGSQHPVMRGEMEGVLPLSKVHAR